MVGIELRNYKYALGRSKIFHNESLVLEQTIRDYLRGNKIKYILRGDRHFTNGTGKTYILFNIYGMVSEDEIYDLYEKISIIDTERLGISIIIDYI